MTTPRAAILALLCDGPAPLCAVRAAVERAGYAPSAVSCRLNVLRVAGLVESDGRGVWALTEAGWRVEIERAQAERLAGLRRDVVRFRAVVAVLEYNDDTRSN